MRVACLLLACTLAAGSALAQPDYATAVRADYQPSLEAIFTDFHRHPELGFQETRTAAKMADELEKAGATVTRGVGRTGVVGVMRNGEGPVVLVRADMDALPIQEDTGLPYASTVRQTGQDGVETAVMHACGHDVHITSMIGTARRLAAMKDRWKGTVVFVVQPSEELLLGAKAMLDDGLYTRFPKPDYALAFHVITGMPAGKVSAAIDISSSSTDSLDVTVHGTGAHGAAPHMSKDPIYIASQIVVALQSIVSRETSPFTPAVVTVGALHAGSSPSTIPDRASLQISVRANDEKTRTNLIAAVERIARGVARTHGIAEDRLPTVRHVIGVPTTVNDPALARQLNAVMQRTFGASAVIPYRQSTMGAEDFAHFLQAGSGVRGYYFGVGGTPASIVEAAKAGGKPFPPFHSPLFQVDPESSVTTGTIAMVAAVLDLLPPGQTISR